MAANHEYIIDSEEWREYQELRRRRPAGRPADAPAHR